MLSTFHNYKSQTYILQHSQMQQIHIWIEM